MNGLQYFGAFMSTSCRVELIVVGRN